MVVKKRASEHSSKFDGAPPNVLHQQLDVFLAQHFDKGGLAVWPPSSPDLSH